MADYFEYRHTAGFEETNPIAHVHYNTNYPHPQGRCRDRLLKHQAPSIPAGLSTDLEPSPPNREGAPIAKAPARARQPYPARNRSLAGRPA